MAYIPPRFLRYPLLRIGLFLTRPRMYLLAFAAEVWLVSQSKFVAFGAVVLADVVQKVLWRTIENIRSILRWQVVQRDQRLMDARAKAYVHCLARGQACANNRPVFMFLRSFAIDKLVEFDPADSLPRPFFDPFHDDPHARNLRRTAFETVLACDLNEMGTTVALQNADEMYSLGGEAWVDGRDTGNTLFFLGPGQVLLNPETWFDSFSLVAQHCDLIISVPIVYLTGPIEANGTIRELRYLFENDLLDKCVFVMPPEQFFEGYAVYRPFDGGRSSRTVEVNKHISELWNDSLPHLEAIGLSLPVYESTDRSVGLFTTRTEQVRHFELRHFRYAMAFIMEELIKDPTRVKRE